MKKKLANLPLDALLETARSAGQNAAIKAVSAGRRVAGWKDGRLVEYGQENVVIAQSSRLIFCERFSVPI